MLGKLLKYDLKSTARLLVPINLFVLLMAILTRLVTTVSFFSERLPVVIRFVIPSFIISLAGCIFFTTIYLAYYFYKSLFTDEGYLAFTLPVTSTQHIFSKLISYTIWDFVNLLVVALSGFIVLYRYDVIDFYNQFKEEFYTYMQINLNIDIGSLIGIIIVFTALSLIFGMIMKSLTIYAAISIGHSMGKRKLLNSFLMYIVLNLASNFITSIILAIFGIGRVPTDTATVTTESIRSLLVYTTWANTILTILISIGFFFITKYFMEKRLNLD